MKVERNKNELKQELSKQALKELEYKIPPAARIVDVKHSYKVNKNVLEYVVTVRTSENIAKVYALNKAEAEQIIKQQSMTKDGEEVIPSNPEKIPKNDIRNEIKLDDKDLKKDEDKNQ